MKYQFDNLGEFYRFPKKSEKEEGRMTNPGNKIKGPDVNDSKTSSGSVTQHTILNLLFSFSFIYFKSSVTKGCSGAAFISVDLCKSMEMNPGLRYHTRSSSPSTELMTSNHSNHAIQRPKLRSSAVISQMNISRP